MDPCESFKGKVWTFPKDNRPRFFDPFPFGSPIFQDRTPPKGSKNDGQRRHEPGTIYKSRSCWL